MDQWTATNAVVIINDHDVTAFEVTDIRYGEGAPRSRVEGDYAPPH
jgi:hypothetical protein